MSLTITFQESELKIILEALILKEEAMAARCEISSDEDEVAEIGNDLIELRLLLNELKEQATQKYGSGILNFSSALL